MGSRIPYFFSAVFTLAGMFIFSACGTNSSADKNDSAENSALGKSESAENASPTDATTATSNDSESKTESTANPTEKLKLEEAQLARELGFEAGDLKARTLALARFLHEGLYPRNFCKAQKRSKDSTDENEKEEEAAAANPAEAYCFLVSDLESPSGVASTRARRRREKRVPVRPHHFEKQQSMDITRLLRSLAKEPAERVLAWVPSLLKKQSCPRNLSAAAALKLENMLPDIVAKEAINKLYEHAASCLMPEDSGYERLHLRQALLNYLWDDHSQALLAINRALLAREPKELSRTLFWAGFLQKRETLKNQYWERLVREYPMSYHALEVWREKRVDPYKMLLSRPHVKISREVSEAEKVVEIPLRWLEALYHYGRTTAAQKLSIWITQEFREELSLSTMLYISSIKSENNIPLNTIVFLNKEIGQNPQLLNEQTLRMLFPKPYFDEFDRASPGLDTYLVLSVARQESGFNPNARSTANARGLLQLLPSTARIVNGRGRKRPNLYDAETNIRLGVRYLDGLVKKFGSVELALAGYNAGPNRVPEWQSRYPTKNHILFMDLIPFQETRDYVALIVRNNYWYYRIYGSEPLASTGSADILQKQKRSALVSDLINSHASAQAANGQN